ncbi:MAG: hypothetical protein RLZZ241_150 [Bacteroidota bacterium]
MLNSAFRTYGTVKFWFIGLVIFGSSILKAYTLNGQNQTFPVWKTEIPFSIRNDTYIEAQEIKGGEILRTSKVTEPTLTVFFPSPHKANGTAVIICPGGGYRHLAITKEGFKVAQWLNTIGITAFVLKYRLPDDEIMEVKSIGPLQDAQEALRLVRRNAQTWGLNPKKIGIMGFSAGGHLAAILASHYDKELGSSAETSARPDFSLLIYPVISMDSTITHQGSKLSLLGSNPTIAQTAFFSAEKQISSETPPAFLVHATNDKSVPVEHSILYYIGLQRNNVPAEMHLYQSGGHGFGLGTNGTHVHWTNQCESWLSANGFLN